MRIIFVKMRFQYLKHSLQKRMVYHSNQLREAIIKLWQSSYPYFRIVDSINDSAIAQISKGTLASILTWPQCYGLCHMGNFGKEGLWKNHSNVESLKRSLKKAWADLDEDTIRNCCANDNKRLEAVVEAEGGYVEKNRFFSFLVNVMNLNLLNISFVLWPHNL